MPLPDTEANIKMEIHVENKNFLPPEDEKVEREFLLI